MDLNLYITKGFPVEWPDDALEQFKGWLKRHGYNKDTVLHVKGEPRIVGESLALTLKSIMPSIHIFVNDTLTNTLPTFICHTDLEIIAIAGKFDFPTIYKYEWIPQLPDVKTEVLELKLSALKGPERHAKLCEAKEWLEEKKRQSINALVLSDICFTGTFPSEVRSCLQ